MPEERIISTSSIMVDEDVPGGILLHDSDKKFRPYTLKAPR